LATIETPSEPPVLRAALINADAWSVLSGDAVVDPAVIDKKIIGRRRRAASAMYGTEVDIAIHSSGRTWTAPHHRPAASDILVDLVERPTMNIIAIVTGPPGERRQQVAV
jgi:hypothetical protein